MSLRGFKPLEITWEGRTVHLPSNKMMRVIAEVESILPLMDLQRSAISGNLPFAKLAEAYATILRHCGFVVDEYEVYLSLFPLAESGPAVPTEAQDIVVKVLQLMLPPDHFAKRMAAIGGNVQTQEPTSEAPSTKPTKLGSPGNSDLEISGSSAPTNSG
jgi:hypothetical protein